MAYAVATRVLVMTSIATMLSCAYGQTPVPPVNPAIDMRGYLLASRDAAEHRETHRLAEDDFLRLSKKPGVVILDARSREKFAALHVAGAINMPFPDIAVATLRDAIPDKDTIILIYCNNNFVNADAMFPSKLPSASLNLSTYIALYTYGYRNVYELGPIIDINNAKLDLESSTGADATHPATLAQIPSP